MIKRFQNSRMEIWSRGYIDNPEKRCEQDRKAVIYQIEGTGDPEMFIVEVGYNADPTKGVLLMKAKGCGCATMFLVFVIIIAIVAFVVAGHYNDTTYSVVINDKERVVTNNDSYYLIFCQDASTGAYYEFKCEDTLLRGKFDSSRFYNQIKEDEQYKFTVVGWRVPFFSMYPNIIKMEEI